MENDQDLTWKVNSSRYISREPWFTVRVDDVTLPNGYNLPKCYVLEYPDWVNVIAVTEDRHFVMVRQYRHGTARVSFEIPAGVTEKTDSSLLGSAQRELQEETGYGGGEWRLFDTLSANPATHGNMVHTFLATGVKKISGQSLDAGEVLTVHLLTEAELLSLLRKGEIVQSLMAAPLWKYFYESGRK